MKFNVVIEKDEDGYFVATVPSLPGCHTQAKSLDELSSRIKEAIEAYLDVKGCIDHEDTREFVGVQVVDVETC
jgi:predicted RNase H-like HicB family nuclease